MRTKKQGGSAVSSCHGSPGNNNRSPKDYHRVAVQFHGGETALAKWKDEGMKGYACYKKK